MNSEISDKDLIERFNKFSRKEHLKRYKEYFKTDTKPPRRREHVIGLQYMNEEDKNEWKSPESFRIIQPALYGYETGNF